MDQISTENGGYTGANEGLLIPESAIPYLNSTRKWTLFFAVLGFVVIALMGLGFVGMLIASAVSPIGGIMAIIAVFYAVLMAVYFFPVYYLLKFSEETKKAIASRNPVTITKSFRYLNLHFKIAGIITIAFIALYIVFIISMMMYGMYFANLFTPNLGY
jgi:hypothetical protein